MKAIETVRLRLRGFRPEDLPDYHARIYSDPDVTRYLPGGQPRPIEGTQKVLEFAVMHGEQHGFTLWAVEDGATGQFMGHCGLVYLQSTPDVEVAYAFGRDLWGQGYASEAARACLRYRFEGAGLAKILALAVPENIASQRVMQKIGMRPEGLTEVYYNTRLALYALEREEWQPDGSAYRVVE